MRCFLALEVAPPVAEYLARVIDGLARRSRDVKWVKKEGIHITLKFLGEIDEGLVDEIRVSLEPAGARFAPFVVSLKEIDAFPSKRRARVVIVRLNQGTGEMKAVYEAVEERLAGFDFEREAREYTPHATLGRMKVPHPFPDGDLPALEQMTFTVDGIVLFKSKLTPSGAIYTPVWKIKFGGEQR